MYKVKFYLMHGWYRDKETGHFKYETVKTNTLDDNNIDKFHSFERERFKVDYIEVVYDYSDCEGDSNE